MRNKLRVYVGTYSQPILFGTGELFKGKGKGIHQYDLDLETGELEEAAPPMEAVNPSYLVQSHDRNFLYAVNEMKEYQGKPQGSLSAYKISGDGKLQLLNRVPTGGTDPCHVNISPDDRCVMVANYMSGSICSYGVAEDGFLEKPWIFSQYYGRGADAKRQMGPHAHSVVLTPDGRNAVVSDLGTDRLKIYKTDFDNKRILTENVAEFETGAGSGPRFCTFNRIGTRCYVFCEITSTIMVLKYTEGNFELMQEVPSVVGECSVENAGADIHLSPDDRFLYASNRGQDSIVVYKLSENGTVEYVQTVSTYGRSPRNFSIDPTGRWLLAGNQDSDTIAVFERNGETGMLYHKRTVSVPTPVCILISR